MSNIKSNPALAAIVIALLIGAAAVAAFSYHPSSGVSTTSVSNALSKNLCKVGFALQGYDSNGNPVCVPLPGGGSPPPTGGGSTPTCPLTGGNSTTSWVKGPSGCAPVPRVYTYMIWTNGSNKYVASPSSQFKNLPTFISNDAAVVTDDALNSLPYNPYIGESSGSLFFGGRHFNFSSQITCSNIPIGATISLVGDGYGTVLDFSSNTVSPDIDLSSCYQNLITDFQIVEGNNVNYGIYSSSSYDTFTNIFDNGNGGLLLRGSQQTVLGGSFHYIEVNTNGAHDTISGVSGATIGASSIVLDSGSHDNKIDSNGFVVTDNSGQINYIETGQRGATGSTLGLYNGTGLIACNGVLPNSGIGITSLTNRFGDAITLYIGNDGTATTYTLDGTNLPSVATTAPLTVNMGAGDTLALFGGADFSHVTSASCYYD